MPDPITRLRLARAEIDAAFGDGYAEAHHELVCAVMASAASDYAATCVATALERSAACIADALVAVDLPAVPIIREPRTMRP
jgi:hypothetical protein